MMKSAWDEKDGKDDNSEQVSHVADSLSTLRLNKSPTAEGCASTAPSTPESHHPHKKGHRRSTEREFFFAMDHTPDMEVAVARPSSPSRKSLGHKKSASVGGPFKPRSKSMSETSPVLRSTYESMARSPAVDFLAQFAQPDEYQTRTTIEDGKKIEQYRVGKVIGRGSFSECREATDENSQPPKKLAMKIVQGDELSGYEGSILTSFDRELDIWRNLHHENILPLLKDISLHDTRIAVTPIAEKGSLLTFINEHGPLSEPQARIMFKQIVEAVYHLHENRSILHGDLKLDNILLDESLRPYVCDFGLSECISPTGEKVNFADAASPNNRLCAQSVKSRREDELFCKGSLWYMAPEEFDSRLMESAKKSGKNPAKLVFKSDIWALGIILYAMITGKLPFNEDFLPRLHAQVTTGKYPPIELPISAELKNLVEGLLTVDPAARLDCHSILVHPWFKM